MNFLSGFISILGPTNVGKSTLLNRILGTKLAIVTPKPQTTRQRIIGIHNGDEYQMIFIDTPGIHKIKTPLHKSMVQSAMASIYEVDALLLLIDIKHPDNSAISSIMKSIMEINKPCILGINKIDLAPKENLLPIIDKFSNQFNFASIIPISALTGDGVDSLIDELKNQLKTGPQFYPDGMLTDQNENALVSEIIREKVYFSTTQELPYSTAVTVDNIHKDKKKKILFIEARIHVETNSQKQILIGYKGQKIKGIGQSARLDLEKMFDTRIFLNLTVRVEKNWSRDSKALRRLGY